MLEGSWRITVATRSPLRAELRWAADVEHLIFDRERDSLRDVVSDHDAVIDIVAYEPDHAQQLLGVSDSVGSLIVISSMSVYADDRGRSMDEADTVENFPELPQPISESQQTVEPGTTTYSTKKVAIEQALLDQSTVPVTIVRAAAIYGPGDTASREWFFVKRVLDSRRQLVLVHNGAVPIAVVASRNLAEIISLAAEKPATRIVNAADPQPQSALSIARSVGEVLEHEWEEILLPGPSPEEPIGENPWAAPRPMVLDTGAAHEELGYQAQVSYVEALRETCQWLMAATASRDWTQVLPNAHKYYGPLFDYAAEDEFLARRT